MTLATSTSEGYCTARIVLLKELDENGFVFYTNYDSRKGRDLTENPQASLVFYWAEWNGRCGLRVAWTVFPATIGSLLQNPAAR